MKSIALLLVVTSLIFTSCGKQETGSNLYNEKATLPASFNFGKKGLKGFASFINKKQKTMSTLYSNDMALNNAISGNKEIAPGATFALVTWAQQPDDNWLGANIPADLQSVELIATTTSGNGTIAINYQLFKGKNLMLSTDTLHRQERINFILSQQPSIMP